MFRLFAGLPPCGYSGSMLSSCSSVVTANGLFPSICLEEAGRLQQEQVSELAEDGKRPRHRTTRSGCINSVETATPDRPRPNFFSRTLERATRMPRRP